MTGPDFKATISINVTGISLLNHCAPFTYLIVDLLSSWKKSEILTTNNKLSFKQVLGRPSEQMGEAEIPADDYQL